MLITATLSKPVSNISEILDKPYIKIKFSAKAEGGQGGTTYFGEFFTEKQVFHKHFSETEVEDFLEQHAGKTFKNCVKRTEAEEITILANKKGKITTLTKKNNIKLKAPAAGSVSKDQKKKNYLIPEGNPVPFLVLLGIMTDDGKVISSKYDKYRQINRFLEFIDDVIPEIPDTPIRIADFGCGKSYLTFAVHYYLTEIKKIPCEIEGLDLKEDVIRYCNEITQKLGLKNLIFHTGNIADYSGKKDPDIVITLHACDTATDFALKYAVERNAKAILSVPCCQHQVNTQLQKNHNQAEEQYSKLFEPLLKYGLIRERFSALVTDALRAQWLENQNYSVQLLEFIDMEHTPKNVLIRAVKKNRGDRPLNQNKGDRPLNQQNKNRGDRPLLAKGLNINPEIWG